MAPWRWEQRRFTSPAWVQAGLPLQPKQACQNRVPTLKISPRSQPMNAFLLRNLPLLLLATGLCTSCVGTKKMTPRYDSKGNFINPYVEGSYDHFTANPDYYPKTYDVWKNDQLLPGTNASNSRIVICLKKQRGLLMRGDDVVMDYPICSGIPSRPTPPGEYKILEKVVDKSSNMYGRIYDAEGNLVVSDADATKDTVPEGGKFVGAPMRNWMRLTNDGVGHHIGPVRRRPASHACVRGPSKVIPIVYGKVKLGTQVTILEDATELHAPQLDQFASGLAEQKAKKSKKEG